MKSLLFKSIVMLMLTIGIVQTSSAYGYYCHRGYGYGCREVYYAPRVYCGPRYVPAPVYYAPAVIPGHWGVNRWGVRVWIGPRYR
jgi:hypothetical protein